MVILNAYGIGGTLSPYYGPATQVNFGDQISWSHGKHTIRVGGEYEDDQWNLSFKSLLRGFLFSPGFDDFLLGRPGLAGCNVAGGCSPANPGNTTGAPVGTYLFCLFCVRSGPNGIIHGYREHDMAVFVQDDWKVNSHLTFNLGVRWEYDGMLRRPLWQPHQCLAEPDAGRHAADYTASLRAKFAGIRGAEQFRRALWQPARRRHHGGFVRPNPEWHSFDRLRAAFWICLAALKARQVGGARRYRIFL